jgi:hypothetical protein
MFSISGIHGTGMPGPYILGEFCVKGGWRTMRVVQRGRPGASGNMLFSDLIKVHISFIDIQSSKHYTQEVW